VTDLGLALRGLRRDRAFTIAAVLTLSGALGATIATFGLINAVLLRPLPFLEPDRLVWVWSMRTDRDKAFFSIPNFLDFRNELKGVSGFAGLAEWGATLTGSGAPERLLALRVTGDLFELLAVTPARGRTLQVADGEAGGQRVVVLSHAVWSRRFGADPDVLGRTLILDGEAHAVVGVLPSDFLMTDRQPPRRAEVIGVVGNVKHFGLDEEPLATLYTPLGQAHEPVFGFILGGANIVVRSDLAPAAVLPGVREAIASVDRDLPTTAARTMEDVLHTLIAPRRLSFWALSLFGGAALGLALAGVYGSVSQNLRQRQREVAIRMALGARASDMVAMLAAQGFSPVLAGVGLGIVATLAGGPLLERTNLFATTPLDLATLTVTPALVALVSAAMATLVAQRAARVEPLQALRGD
jgi:putative ABC transport system permease protein